MGLFATIAKDGVQLIPWYYKAAGIAVVLTALIGGGRYIFDRDVNRKVDADIQAYVLKKNKEEVELSAINIKDNTKYQIVYQDRVQVITKVVHDNSNVIMNKVPDIKTILSDGWVSAFNASTKGKEIDPVAASAVTTLSNINADEALDIVSNNNGICLSTREQLIELQGWIIQKQAEVAALNRKSGVK